MTLEPAEYLNAKLRTMEDMLEGKEVDPRLLKRFGFKPSRKVREPRKPRKKRV